MIYVFLLSFFIFSIINYLYIYTYLDSKIFYSENGSKLNRYIKENQKKINSKIKIKYQSKRLNFFSNKNIPKNILLIIIFFLMEIISLIIFKDILFSNFVILNLGYKKIELVSSFDNYFNNFKYIYYVSYTLFIILFLIKNRNNRLIDNLFVKKHKDVEYLPIDESITIAKNNEGEEVKISIQGLYQNLLITGSIGSGKTSSAISKITDELISKGYSGLILDIKGNYVKTVDKICEKYGVRDRLFVLSDKNDLKYNVLQSDIKPIEMASRIKQVLEIISPSNNSDSYWLDKVENVLFNMIILIRYYNDNKIDFMEIHKLTTNIQYLEDKILECKTKLMKTNVDNKTAFEMSNVIMFFEKEYMMLENRIRNIISSEITRVTIPFVTSYNAYKRFGSFNDEDYIDGVKKDGIFVLSINIADNKVLSKMLAAFIKLEFQKKIISNISNSKTTFLIADEYQEFSNIEDAHFLSLSREAKCINILSMQSYTSLKKSLKNELASQVIIQNMVNKIWFRNDDNYTVGEIVKQIGKEEITKENIAISEGAQETKKNLITKGFRNKKSNISKTINYVQSKENIYNENYFTKELKTFEAVCFLSDGISIKKIQKVIFERWDIENDKNSNSKIHK